ncbi:MAG: DUF4465 domain-containing protein [Muribaculaceae bacterium]|nr:DUF4465 domain-containing protein [Muribaculaceae bacterium]
MKRLIFSSLIAAALTASASDLTVLDLSKTATPLEFNAETGAWSETYNDAVTTLESQIFRMAHYANSEWMSWNGFTASNSADNSFRDNFIKYQFSNMAKGGVNPDSPYLIGFYGAFYGEKACSLTFTDGLPHQVQGAYFNLTSYTYYTVEQGDAYCRPFNDGDRLTLTVHGVDAAENEKTVDITLASFADADLTINRGWKYVDLSSLGAVNQLYFTIYSTDQGEWGINTPCYFAMDKLSVETAPAASIAAAHASGLKYDSANKVVTADGFVAVYDCAGRLTASSDSGILDLGSMPAGVYLIKSGAATLKVIR